MRQKALKNRSALTFDQGDHMTCALFGIGYNLDDQTLETVSDMNDRRSGLVALTHSKFIQNRLGLIVAINLTPHFQRRLQERLATSISPILWCIFVKYGGIESQYMW